MSVLTFSSRSMTGRKGGKGTGTKKEEEELKPIRRGIKGENKCSERSGEEDDHLKESMDGGQCLFIDLQHTQTKS